MKQLNNKTTRYFTSEEQMAILRAEEELSKAFKKRVHSITVNPIEGNPDDVYGIAFAFDLVQEGYKEGERWT